MQVQGCLRVSLHKYVGLKWVYDKYMSFIYYMFSLCNLSLASFPGLPRFFVLRFVFSIIHGGGRAQRMGKAWEHLSRE